MQLESSMHDYNNLLIQPETKRQENFTQEDQYRYPIFSDYLIGSALRNLFKFLSSYSEFILLKIFF
jgi:hypothetical protein